MFEVFNAVLFASVDAVQFLTAHAPLAHCALGVVKATAYLTLTLLLLRGRHHPVLAYAAVSAALILDTVLDVFILTLGHGAGGS